ncbi:putative Response regulator, CheY-like [Candidatus Nitrospira nitrosa]|uniref:Putative Response regulator, CheY-like n=1 Tax=Candidatus Nitrospira nitrosa TaxID=1742972 RepID=A0A0S4L9P3_9BACT|nr:response regulator [Candidatus Nitrospira nitrosa]CUS33534.1 putative Response regulator, CheY-like [Candidatus Nitrospira nitrosa]
MTKLLIVDDDRMNCDLLQDLFSRQGYDVILATSGREGLDQFRMSNPKVTLLDLRMPEMDGLTVLKEIRAIDPHAAVIILGGGATDVHENQARALRATDFIRKGLSLDILVEAVNRVSKLPGPSMATQPPCRDGEVGQQSGESVLVVDDEPLVCDLFVRFLSLRGYRAYGVRNGQDALRMVDEVHPDALLLDMVMPEMGGIDVLRALRDREYPGGIIIMTGSHNEELLGEAWSLGPHELLVKPVDLDRLLMAIQLVLVCREC